MWSLLLCYLVLLNIYIHATLTDELTKTKINFFDLAARCKSSDDVAGFCVKSSTCTKTNTINNFMISKLCINQTQVCCEKDYIFSIESRVLTSDFGTPCETPLKDEGLCIPIQDCQLLNDVLNVAEARFYLLESSCGPSNENKHFPLVCCSKNGTNSYIKKVYENINIEADSVEVNRECGKQVMELDIRIIGGTEASDKDFPWFIQLLKDDFFSCTGFLISNWYGLTAAHCGPAPGKIHTALLGKHNHKDKNTEIRVNIKQFIYHPKYKETDYNYHHDIAVLKFENKINFNSFVYPICLFREPKYVNEYWIGGWGRTEYEIVSFSKLKVNVPMVNFKLCQDMYRAIGIRITQNQICCGGEKRKDTCSGDSGGPLMFYEDRTWFASGIVSFGVGCGTDYPSIYTNISSYKKWILEQINKNTIV